jgi:hypothetical protein
MTHPSKIQRKLERQTQRTAQKAVRVENRRASRQQRLQLRHEREMSKIESGYYHKRSENLTKFGQTCAEVLGSSLAPIIGALSSWAKS